MVARSGPGWTLAPCLEQMVDEADTLAPKRIRVKDGSIGDQSHQARKSDHNPDADHTVDALDLTHSPAHGWDCQERVDQIVARRDRRVLYLIFNRRIWRSYKSRSSHPEPWTPEPYTGSNTHEHHMHTSVRDDFQNDRSPWWPTTPTPPEDEGMYLDIIRALWRTKQNDPKAELPASHEIHWGKALADNPMGPRWVVNVAASDYGQPSVF